MNLFKRCTCADSARCRHPFWFRYRLHRHRYRESTHTASRTLAGRIAEKYRLTTLEGKHGLRRRKAVRLSEQVKTYVKHTAKANRTAYKDRAVLDTFLASVGDRALDEVSPFHVERWKQERAEAVSLSTVNRELNIVRAVFPGPSNGAASRSRRCRPFSATRWTTAGFACSATTNSGWS